MCSITTKRYIFNFELNRRVPNGMHGGVRGRSKSALLDYCEDKTIEMFLRFRCLDLNTRHNHSTSLRFCFQGCLQRHLNFLAADIDHLDFLF